MMKPKCAIVGSGVSGLVSAYLLRDKYDVTIFESNDYVGGHTHTVNVTDEQLGLIGIDTGFIVFNALNYPLFISLLDELAVPFENSDMSFGFYDEQKHFCYGSDFPFGFFSQVQNIVKPYFWNIILDLFRFNRLALSYRLKGLKEDLTIFEFLKQHHFSEAFIHSYVVPMGAAIWSCSYNELFQFPALSFFNFWHNHGLLKIFNRPQWKTVSSGSISYVNQILNALDRPVRLNCPVKRIERRDNKVVIEHKEGIELFDACVCATHADQVPYLLHDLTPFETRFFSSWRYSKNHVYLHRDSSVMPPYKSAWSSWNYFYHSSQSSHLPVTVSYYMNRLQNIVSNTDYFVTLNPVSELPEDRVLGHYVYDHPVFTNDSLQMQRCSDQLNQAGPLYFSGSYFGYGFHEDAVRSAVNVSAILGGYTL